MNFRQKKIIHKIDVKNGVGLEIGPLSTPILTKNEAKIYYADHMSTNALINKYKDEPVISDDIVKVDYVISNKPLVTAVKNKKFDYVIASHVIEHIPDIISWFKEISLITKKNGIISLVIPDKRYTFDITRRESIIADVIGAYVEKRTKTDSVTMYDYLQEYRSKIFAYEVNANPYKNFSYKPKRYSNKEAWDLTLKNYVGKEYVDAHCYVFTPYSFFEIIKKLTTLGLFDFEVIDFIDTAPSELEFYVTLKKINKFTPTREIINKIPKINKPKVQQELLGKINSLENNNRMQKHEIEVMKKTIENIRHSKSWKITIPLRKINRYIKNKL